MLDVQYTVINHAPSAQRKAGRLSATSPPTLYANRLGVYWLQSNAHILRRVVSSRVMFRKIYSRSASLHCCRRASIDQTGRREIFNNHFGSLSWIRPTRAREVPYCLCDMPKMTSLGTQRSAPVYDFTFITGVYCYVDTLNPRLFKHYLKS